MLKVWLFTRICLLVIVSGICLSACGGSTAPPVGSESTIGSQPALPLFEGSQKSRQAALSQALIEIDGLTVPKGVDEARFEMLRYELARMFTELYSGQGKSAFAIGDEDYTGPWCLQASALPSGTLKFSWRAAHYGDYDINGEVAISDLTPLASHFLACPQLNADGLPVVNGENEWRVSVDGNGDGEINAQDIVPIAVNWQSKIQGFRVYLGTSTDGTNFNWEGTYLPCAEDATLPFSVRYNSSRKAGEVNLYSISVAQPEIPAGAGLYARVVAYNGTLETIEAIVPVYYGPHQMFSCDVCHNVVDMEFRGIEQSCHNCHPAPPEDTGALWADTVGSHGMCMTCHASHGFTIEDYTATCGICHSSQASKLSGSAMQNCMDCHETGHIPNSAPQAADCQACHTSPPDKPEVQWDAAPGSHGTCAGCHSGHNLVFTEPSSLCTNCHQAQIDAGHAEAGSDCLLCHLSPHVPEKSLTGFACTDCHPTPPEDATAEWTDAPGNHGMCFMCHNIETHGAKPEPPESICGNCHQDTIDTTHSSADTACLDCHTFPHLPNVTLTADTCTQCHATPPEDETRTWAEAPGLHSDCAQCHEITVHGDKPVPSQSICADCHQADIDAGHAGGSLECMACHGFTHLPDVFVMADQQCFVCHPEQQYTGWGNHTGSCMDCHPAGVHPPTGGWDACWDCH